MSKFSPKLFLISMLYVVQLSLGSPVTADQISNDIDKFLHSTEKTDPSDPAGQFRLGKMYDKGEGVEKDKALALSWYRKAANQGYAEAQLLLGIMYDQGVGVNQDYNQAILWYRKAADQGYAKAQYNLGAMYDEGLGLQQDYVEAANWYRKAADQGYAKAQFNLGSMYMNGEGALQDKIQGYMWLTLAAEHGLAEQVKKLLDLENDLSNAEIKKAKKMARQWKSQHKQIQNLSKATTQVP